MTRPSPTVGATALWVVLLTLASLATTWALACLMPFAALAALAATHLRARAAAALMLAAWAVSQAVGYGLLGYPHDPLTAAWGGALGLAALGAAAGARLAAGALPARGEWTRLAAAFAGGFAAFKAVLLLADLVLGGPVASTVGLGLLAAQLPREAAITAALLALYRALVAAGAPALPAPRPRAALA